MSNDTAEQAEIGVAGHEAEATTRECRRSRTRGRFVFRYTSHCACGWESRPKAQKWAVEDDRAGHAEKSAVAS